MPRAHIELDKRAVIAPVRHRTFGAFVEHLGRCVYTWLYEPGHPTANEDGFRMDVVELVRELGTRDLAWHSLEPNQVGLDEFARWLKLTGAELMPAVNQITEAVTPANADVYAKNTLADQERVKPAANASAALTDGVLTIELPPVSWTAAALC